MASRTASKFGLEDEEQGPYLKLVSEFPLLSIQSDAHMAAAQTIMDRLLARPALGHGEELYLDALSDLVAAYEDVHHGIPPASDADMLRHLLDAKKTTPARLSRETGLARSTLSEVLAGKRPFSKRMIRALADYFHVDTSVLASNL